MTTIDIYRTKDGFIKRFVLENHADNSDNADGVVCAIISTISQAVLIGLEEVVKLEDFDYTISDEAAFLECEIPISYDDITKEKISILTETMCLTLKQAYEQYPSYVEYVEIIED